MTMKYDLAYAAKSLHPTAQFVLRGDQYEGLEWHSTNITKPTKAALEAEQARLQAIWDNTEYQRLRALEYPPMADYLDAIAKGDEEQKQEYIDACLAVKAKYPKPEGA
jgi:hypothetical protein